MSDTQKTLDEAVRLLCSGQLSPEQQAQLGRDLVPVGIEHRKALWFRDEQTREAAEQEQIDHRRRVEEQMASARRLGLRIAPAIADVDECVLPFPVRGRFAESAVS